MITVLHKLYPTKKQEIYLAGNLWSAIGIENWAIAQVKHSWEHGFPLACMKPLQIRSVLSKRIKGHAERCGLSSALLNNCIAAVCETVGRHGIHKTRFKSHRKKNSFYLSGGGSVKIDKDGRLKLVGLKTSIKMSEQDKFHARLPKVTLIRKVDGWYAACVYDMDRPKIRTTDNREAGVDPGLKTALVLSDGTEHVFPQFYRDTQALLAKLQCKSKNSGKVKRLHKLIAAQRRDHHHKLSTKLAKEHQKIYWSNDNFNGLKQMKNLGKAYSDIGLGAFRMLLQAKLASRSDGQGNLILVSNRYSTQDCSACGARTGPKGVGDLGVREWVCHECGSIHDRDRNAAINTLLFGRGASADLGNCS